MDTVILVLYMYNAGPFQMLVELTRQHADDGIAIFWAGPVPCVVIYKAELAEVRI